MRMSPVVMEAIDAVRYVMPCCLAQDEIAFSRALGTADHDELHRLADRITAKRMPFQTLEWFLHKERAFEEPAYLYEGCATSKQQLHEMEAKIGPDAAACFEARANHMDWLSKLLLFLGNADAGKWAAQRRSLAGGCANSLFAASDAHMKGDLEAEKKARAVYRKKREQLFAGFAPHLRCD